MTQSATMATPRRLPFAVPVCLLLAVLGGCSSGPLARPASPLPERSSVAVAPVKNLAGVPLRIPEIWFGDSLEVGEKLEVERLDLLLTAEAALLARLRGQGFDANAMETSEGAGATFQVHAAISRFDADKLRATGQVTLGITLFVTSSETGEVLGRADAEKGFQLLDAPPDEVGALGEARLIRTRLESFVEYLVADALAKLAM